LDKRSLSTLSKFAAQFFVAFLVVLTPRFGGETLMLRISGSTVLNQAVAILWIVGVINAINFLDIMDGLAAGVSAIAALGLFFLASFVGQGAAYAGLAIALAGSALGFLIYNFEPASIFMGDAGSQFLGFILGTLALLVASSSTSFVTVVSPIVLLGIPLFEITFTVTVRTLTGKAFWKGSKDHYPLRMFQLGFSVRQIVLASYVVGLVLLWCSIWMTQASLTGQLIMLVLLALFAIGAGLWLSRVEVPRPSTSTKPAILSASTGKPSDVEVTKGTRWAKE
jgi:UDP-GlcNAc:undecaprenyl-phosphate GlcNAc-1-phosphate transferase